MAVSGIPNNASYPLELAEDFIRKPWFLVAILLWMYSVRNDSETSCWMCLTPVKYLLAVWNGLFWTSIGQELCVRKRYINMTLFRVLSCVIPTLLMYSVYDVESCWMGVFPFNYGWAAMSAFSFTAVTAGILDTCLYLKRLSKKYPHTID